MRIDYVLLPSTMLPRLLSSVICGHGRQRHGFLGSDHCPIVARIAAEGAEEGAEEGAAVQGQETAAQKATPAAKKSAPPPGDSSGEGDEGDCSKGDGGIGGTVDLTDDGL
jgi:hypothetical protein